MRYWTTAGLALHRRKLVALEKRIDELGKLIGDACAETSETFHDNAPFEIVRHDLAIVDGQLRRAHELLKDSTILEYPATISDGKVCYGCKVQLVIDKVLETYYIVGYGHGSMEYNRMLYDSPLAQRIIGHKSLESFSLDFGQRTQIVTLLKVEPVPKTEWESWTKEIQKEV